MIEEEYISFETAKLAKEKGFDIPIRYGFSERRSLVRVDTSDNWNQDKELYSRPTQSLLARWLREKHNIHVIPRPIYESELGLQVYGCNVHSPNSRGLVFCDDSKISSVHKDFGNNEYSLELGSYEEALESGLKYALSLIK